MTDVEIVIEEIARNEARSYMRLLFQKPHLASMPLPPAEAESAFYGVCNYNEYHAKWRAGTVETYSELLRELTRMAYDAGLRAQVNDFMGGLERKVDDC